MLKVHNHLNGLRLRGRGRQTLAAKLFSQTKIFCFPILDNLPTPLAKFDVAPPIGVSSGVSQGARIHTLPKARGIDEVVLTHSLVISEFCV